MSDDYIELTDQIITKSAIARLYWEGDKLWLVIPGEADISLEGEDARTVWRAFSSKDWRE